MLMKEWIKAKFEEAKKDRPDIVPSDIRQMCGELLRLSEKIDNERRLHVYFMHRLNAPTAEERLANVEAAGKLMAEVTARIPIVPYASWLTLARYWTEDRRAQGLAIDRLQISRCDETWQTGPVLSSGMNMERGFSWEFCKPSHNLVGLSADEIVAWFEDRMQGDLVHRYAPYDPSTGEPIG